MASAKKAKHVCKHIFSVIGFALLALLIVIVGWLFVDKFIRKSAVPSIMGYSYLIVATGSMSSTIEAGDFVIIKDVSNYKTGDIISFIGEGDTIPTTHRIISINADGTFVTKGDSNNAADEQPVKPSQILGKVVTCWHGVGVFIAWLTTGGGYWYIIALLVLVGVSIYLFRRNKRSNSNNINYKK